MRKFAFAIPAFLIAVICGVFVWASRPAVRPRISITFLGYTNGPVGVRPARFALSNLGPSTVLADGVRVEVPDPTAPGGINATFSSRLAFNSFLYPGGTRTIIIPAPTNLPSWRLRLYVSPDVGVTRAIKRLVVVAEDMINMRPRYQSFDIQSDWIEDKP